MFYFVYQTTNLKNNKIYVGVHQTSNINDGYLGSGKHLRRAIKKYGKETFCRIIIEYFNTAEEAYIKEAEIVNDDFIKNPNTYNMCLGGSGASILANRKPFTGTHSDATKRKISLSKIGKTYSEEFKQKQRDNSWALKEPERHREHAKRAGALSWRTESGEKRKHSDLTAKKIGESLTKYFKENGSPTTGIKRSTVTCPHCGKSGANNTMSRWHFNNCKKKSMVTVM